MYFNPIDLRCVPDSIASIPFACDITIPGLKIREAVVYVSMTQYRLAAVFGMDVLLPLGTLNDQNRSVSAVNSYFDIHRYN